MYFMKKCRTGENKYNNNIEKNHAAGFSPRDVRGNIFAQYNMNLLSTVAVALVPIAMLAAPEARAQELPSFAVIAGSTITNTGPTTITGNIGLSPGLSITGANDITLTGQTFIADDVAVRMQADLTTLYNFLASRPATSDLTGQDLGGLTLTPGVYSFSSSAGLTGNVPLTLDGGGNPNAVFIFNIESTLITGSATSIVLQNGAQGGNVFFRVGSSATLGTTTDFQGQIVAYESITLNSAATIDCGAAFARVSAVTLNNNTIGICTIDSLAFEDVFGDDDTPLTDNAASVARALDDYVTGGGVLPSGFAILALTLTPDELAAALSQLSGEAATGVAPTGMQSMDSFLNLALSGGRGRTTPGSAASPSDRGPAEPGTVSTLGYGPIGSAAKDGPFASRHEGLPPRNWSAWGGAYGSRGEIDGDASIGSHDRTSTDYGVAFGVDYQLDPSSRVGFALGAGGASFDLGDDVGSGSSDTYHVAVHGRSDLDAAYVLGAIAYGYNDASTERTVTIAGTDRFAASFGAHNVAGHLEGGYRIGWITPYAAVRGQVFMTPSYSERTIEGVSTFALDYEKRTATALRTELGVGAEWSVPFDGGSLDLRMRAAWAHDHGDDNDVDAAFQAIAGSGFTVSGATPDRDSILLSAGAGFGFDSGMFVSGSADGKLAMDAQIYSGNVKLGYAW
ncbi:DUF3494 domain-containing protein [Aquibium carbonis]|uniref:DUF3494 domain-containing protein n=1 Tax=Aquibium carbonis TaxID=2495581 RepID=A0A3R9YAU4_9HYPH|nr:ice-binding family protein [Aquibium carbonis]RST83495.1 DUF3494 domain-containing protein [Aquibium carbonis]